jgi:N-acyl-L-homoserine lactone synthetase
MEFRCEWVNASDAHEALDIRRRVYTEEFGFDLGGEGPSDDIDQRAHHLVAKTLDGEPVAALRLVDATDRPFEIESFLDLRSFLDPAWHPAEITRLCILPRFRRITQASFVHLAVLEAVLRLTRRLGVTHIIASTRQELMPVYRYLLFDAYPDITYTHSEIGNAVHTLMSLDLGTFPERCRRERPTLYSAVEAAYGKATEARLPD